jgi:adenosylhomocysteine nucleosidase
MVPHMSVTAGQLLILTALELEAKAVEKALSGHGKIAVVQVGLRACRMPADIAKRGANCIIMAGLCGALDPQLAVGDVVLDDPTDVLMDMDDAGNSRLRRGAIHTSPKFLATPADKAELFKRTGALAVDMEDAIVRRAVEGAKIPVISVRAVSDTASEAIDPAFPGLIDDFGRPRPAELAKLMFFRPMIVPQLMRLQANSQKALSTLALAVECVVEHLLRLGA